VADRCSFSRCCPLLAVHNPPVGYSSYICERERRFVFSTIAGSARCSLIRGRPSFQCAAMAWRRSVVATSSERSYSTSGPVSRLLGWATADCHTTSVCECDQPAPGPTQPPTLGETGIEYQPKCGWGVKAGISYSTCGYLINVWTVGGR